jgi:hypothetical protein
VPVPVSLQTLQNQSTGASGTFGFKRKNFSFSSFSGIKSQQVVIDKSISAAISPGARSRTFCVPEKNPSTSSYVSSKILNEIYLLQVRLSNVIASTGAVVVNRRRIIGKITDNYQEPIGRGGFG